MIDCSSAGFTVSPTKQIFHLIDISLGFASLRHVQQWHAQIAAHGYSHNPFSATKLISAYAISGAPAYSKLVFCAFPIITVCLWNSLMDGYVKNLEHSKAFGLFHRMHCSGVVPDDYSLTTISKVCGELNDLNAGKLIHGLSVRIGCLLDTVLANSLMSMYCKCLEYTGCLNLFDEMPTRNLCSWNTVIAGYACSQDQKLDEGILGLIKDMKLEGLKPDAFTVSSLLSLCRENAGKCSYGRELHGYIVRNGLFLPSSLSSKSYLSSCLIEMYSRTCNPLACRRVFDQTKQKNIYVWTSMINNCLQNGAVEEALTLFRGMQVKHDAQLTSVSLVTILRSCFSLSGLNGGKQIHGYAIRKELDHNASLCNALIDMYSKCGNLNYARQVFDDGVGQRDAISWSAMISGYSLHGKGKEAIVLYERMIQLGNKPDMIMVVGVLSACGRSGLVEDGLEIYKRAITQHGVAPTVEICSCVVNMLGQSGQLGRALDFIKAMPMMPGPSVWGAFVSASVLHGNHEMQDLAYRFLIELEPSNPSNYVSLSNLHAYYRRWDVVADVRTMMKERGLRKTPGYSWISVHGKTHSFCVSDKLHPCSAAIHEMLLGLLLIMKRIVCFHDSDNELSYLGDT